MKKLSNIGYIIDLDEIDKNILNEITKLLNVCPLNNYNINEREYFKFYKLNKNKIALPEKIGFKYFGKPDIITNIKYRNINIEFTKQLKQIQLEPYNKTIESLKNPELRGGLLNLNCGAGKTVIAIKTICEMKVKTLIVVHKSFLIDQWIERIHEFSNNSNIGLIKADKIDVKNRDIVIASLQSLSMKNYDNSLFKRFGYLIIDEVHHIGAKVFSNALFKKMTIKYIVYTSMILL